MRQVKTFGRRVSKWRVISENVEPHLERLPGVRPVVEELRTLISKADDLDARQEMARGALLEIIRERQALERAGEVLRTRLANHLRGAFGAASMALVQFGIAPRKPRGRGKKKAGDGTAPGS